MNILFITRLYSGFEESLSKKVWKPEGVPTIYRLLNELDRSHNLSIVLTAKDSGHTYVSKWSEKNDINLNLRGLRAGIKILAGISYFPSFFPRRFAMIVRDLRQLLCSIKNVHSNNPDLIYCDSANITIACSLSLLFPNKPIVVRVLGACSFLRSIVNSKRIVHIIYRFAFKGRFSAVIGTQDGSGIEYWLDRILNKNVPRYILLNGVDAPSNKKKPKKYLSVEKRNKAKDEIAILFIGRLEEYKGIRIFVEAVIQSIKTSKKNIHAIIVGNGSLYEEVVELCLSYGCSENFSFTKNVPHEKILDFHAICDIYISTNQDGNLSNANLEAISSNDCMIIPHPRSTDFIDIKTSSLLGNSVLHYKVDNIDDLKNKILSLVENPKLIKQMEQKISQKKLTFLRTWDERVREEINILKENHRKKLIT